MTNPTNKNLIIIGLLIACGVLAGGLIYSQFELPGKESDSILSVEEAARMGLDYINENLLPQGITASMVGAPSEEKDLYRFKIRIGEEEFFSYITKDGKVLFPEGIDLESEISPVQETPEIQEELTIGNFSVSEDEVCLEDGKPIIYFFGSQTCPYCTWEHPIMERVAEKFTNYISFHNNMDSNEDMDMFGKYSTGGIPTLVFGCKYYRVGAGTQSGEEQETKNLTALICKLTGSQPADVCEGVGDLINQIND